MEDYQALAGLRRVLRSISNACPGQGEMHVFALLAQVAWEAVDIRQEDQSQAKLMGMRSFKWQGVPLTCSEAKTRVSMGVVLEW